LAIRTEDSLETISPRIREIVEASSTRYLDSYPVFLPTITTILDSARDSIRIACDVPGYGMFSNYEWFVNYQSALKRKAGLADVRMTVFSRAWRDSITRLQFSDRSFETFRRTPRFREFLTRFGKDSLSIQTLPDLMRVIEDQEVTVLNEFRGVKRREHRSRFPIFLWIVDDRVAVFSMPKLSAGAGEAGFRTYDPKLIGELKRIFDTYWTESDPWPPPGHESR